MLSVSIKSWFTIFNFTFFGKSSGGYNVFKTFKDSSSISKTSIINCLQSPYFSIIRGKKFPIPTAGSRTLIKSFFIIGNFFKVKSGWAVWNRIFKREIIEQNKIRFSEKYKIGEDQLFCLEYLLYANSVKIINKILYNYEEVPTSIMHTNTIDLHKKSLMFMDRLALNKENKMYYFYFMITERNAENKITLREEIKKQLGNNAKIKLINYALSKRVKMNLKWRAKLIKNIIFD